MPIRHLRLLPVNLALICLFQTVAVRADWTTDHLWARVLRSPLIVTGTLHAPPTILLSPTHGVPGVLVDVKIGDAQFLKGQPPQGFTDFQWMVSQTGDDGVAVKDLYALDGHQVIAFLRYGGHGYVVDHTQNDSVTPIDAVGLDAIRTEISKQARLDNSVRAYIYTHSPPHQFYVDFMTFLLRHSLTASFAAHRLAAQDCSYVPALVKAMDDRRVVALGETDAPEKGLDSYPAYTSFTPQEVVDALSVTLTGIAQAPLGDIHNGGTEFQRQQAVSDWRTYVGLYFSNGDTGPFGHFTITDPSPQACKGLP